MATDDEDPIDEELGDADPEATGQAALDTLGASPPAAAAPPAVTQPAISGQPGQEMPPEGTPPSPLVIPPPSAVPAGTHAVKGTRTVEATAPNADIVGGQAAEQKVFRDEKKLAGDQAALQGEAARIEQERAEKIADETARQNAAIQAEQQHQADLAQQRAEQFSRDIDELKRSKPPGGFSEWAGGKRALASMSIALGGLVAGRTGTANLALADVNREVEQEQKRYQQGIENQFRALSQRQGLNHDLDNQAKDALARGEARKVMALDSLNKYADAQLKALGIPAAQQAGIKAQLGLDQQAAQAQQNYGKLLSSKVTDAVHFAPGKGGGTGGGGDAVTNLVKMAENGSKRSEIVAAAAAAHLPEKLWKNQVDLAFVEREKGDAKRAEGAAKAEQADVATEILDFNGNKIGNTAPGRGGASPIGAVESRKRTGAAQALVAQLDEAIAHLESAGTVVGVPGVDVLQSENYKERNRLLSGIQAKARAFSELPASEGGLHLEHAQIGSVNGASPKQLKKFRQDIIDQTNLKNRALLTSASRAKGEGEGGGEKPGGSRVAPEGTVIVGAGGKTMIKKDGKWVSVK